MKGIVQWIRKPWVIVILVMLLMLLLGSVESQRDQSQATQTEARIAEVLSTIKGVGDVEVVLYYQTSSSSLYDQNTQTPTGAIVVAQGADDVSVQLSLIRAMQTLLSLPQSAVDVFAMEEKP